MELALVMYALVAAASFGGAGTVVNAYVAMHLPADVPGAALGWALGVGRIGVQLPLLGPQWEGRSRNTGGTGGVSSPPTPAKCVSNS